MSELISLVFDVNDPFFTPAMAGLRWVDLWPRSFQAGGSEAHLGAFTITLITIPFTAGEDVTFTWALAQDECALMGVYHMSDGRDLLLLERNHVKQSRAEAIQEQRRHLARKLAEIGIPASSMMAT